MVFRSNCVLTSLTPSWGLLVTYRTVPPMDPEPNSVPCGPRRVSTRWTSYRSRSGVNSEMAIGVSSR